MKGSTVLQALYRSTRACKNPRLPNAGKGITIWSWYIWLLISQPLWKHHWHQRSSKFTRYKTSETTSSSSESTVVSSTCRKPGLLLVGSACIWELWPSVTLQNRWVALFRSIWIPVMEKISTWQQDGHQAQSFGGPVMVVSLKKKTPRPWGPGHHHEEAYIDWDTILKNVLENWEENWGKTG